MEKYLQHTKDCSYDPAKGNGKIGLVSESNPCTCGLHEFMQQLRESRSIPGFYEVVEGEIESNDTHCRIRTSTPELREKARKSILWLGSQAADRLLDEPILEIRKFQSGNMEMTHCAVVCCTRKVLWNIPRSILERVVVK